MAIPFRADYPTQYVLGSRDPAKAAAFLTAFGLQPRLTEPVSREAANKLYGIDRELWQIVMSPTGINGSGTVRIVETPHQSPPLEDFHIGFHGLDIYSRNVELSRKMGEKMGGRPGPITPYPVVPFDDWTITETRIESPDSDYVVFISESTREYPGVWPDDDRRMYSDLLTFVSFIDAKDLDDETAFWTETFGLNPYTPDPVSFDNERIAKLMGLEREADMGCVLFSDEGETRRLELLYYHGESPVKRTDRPLHTGWNAVGFETEDVQAAMGHLSQIDFSEPVAVDSGDGIRRVVSGVSPGGLRFELIGEAV